MSSIAGAFYLREIRASNLAIPEVKINIPHKDLEVSLIHRSNCAVFCTAD